MGQIEEIADLNGRTHYMSWWKSRLKELPELKSRRLPFAFPAQVLRTAHDRNVVAHVDVRPEFVRWSEDVALNGRKICSTDWITVALPSERQTILRLLWLKCIIAVPCAIVKIIDVSTFGRDIVRHARR